MDDLQPLVPETPAAPADADTGALAEHEASYSPVALPDDTAVVEGRDATSGRFLKGPRRRAASQQADAEDVPAIHELTKRLKTAEETAGKDITRKTGESERVFTLRRRAEIAERLAAPSKPTEPVAAAPIAQHRQSQPISQTFPSYEQFVAYDGLANATYEDYTDARADWRYNLQRAQERQQDAAQTAQRDFQTKATTHLQRVADAKAQHPDWDRVVTNDLPISGVIHDAVLASAQSADVQYYLGTHRDELAALVSESQDYSPSAVIAMRRYLDTLVASPQRASLPSRAAAGSTGSALALAPPPAPRPPNPVRTGAVTPADEPPGDDNQSLAAHEQFFSRRRRS